MFTDCGGWWCDEWLCDIMCCCSYRYFGLADADEVVMAASVALQAYYEGRPITREGMDKCIEYWRKEISELHDPEGKARSICCEHYQVPLFDCAFCYEVSVV
jgi:7-keto-8-aminopelargonate synthetase-like enzyme